MKQKRLRQQEYTEQLYKKCLNYPDNHDGVVTHLEPDILECDVKWALGSITTNKASAGDGISAELFQILKEDAIKVLHSICQKIWRTVATGLEKVNFHFKSPRRAMPKNVLTAIQLHYFHMLASLCLKSLKLGFSST